MQNMMSALHPKADVRVVTRDVCYGPKADIRQKIEEAAWGQAASKRTSRLGTEGNLSDKNPYATFVAFSRANARRSSSRRR